MKKIKPLKPNRNNIETYLPIFKGFYGSIWEDIDFYGEAEHFGLPEDFPFWEYINYSDYHEALAKSFTSSIETALSDYVERIDYQSISSPKEYNFTNDSINCIIRPKKQAIKDFIFAHETAFREYLKDHLKSRDGFISFHSWDFTDWQEDTKNFTAFDKKADPRGFNLGFILQFIAEQEGLNDYLEENYSDVGVYYSNYYNSEFDKIVNALEGTKNLEYIELDRLNSDSEYTDKLPNIKQTVSEITALIQDNYIKTNLEEIVMQKYKDTDEAEYINLEKLYKSVTSEIENQTLKLEL